MGALIMLSSLLKKKSVRIAAIVTTIVLLCVAIAHFGGSNPVSNAIRSVFAPFQSGFAYIANSVKSTGDFLAESGAYKEENERLVAEINELKKQNRDITSYREENETLKELLELKQNISEYTTVAATVIAYSPNNWYDMIEISKGSLSGINVGNAVITPDGVVGKVVETGPNWSLVSTIIGPDNALGVKISRTGDVAVVEGDREMYRSSVCRMTFIDKDSNLIVGDLLETTAAGGVYPDGLTVGSVREVNADAMGNLNYAVVEPSVDFSRLYGVLVINGMN